MYARNLRVFPHDTLWCFKEFIASALRGYQTKEPPLDTVGNAFDFLDEMIDDPMENKP